MKTNLLSFWAFDGHDLESIHLGHIALLTRVAHLLARDDETVLTVCLNRREKYGVVNGLSSQHRDAYHRFFEHFFRLNRIANWQSRVTVHEAADIITEVRTSKYLTHVQAVFEDLAAMVATHKTPPTADRLRAALRSVVRKRGGAFDDLQSALRPYLPPAGDGKTIRMFEEMAVHNTAILAAFASRRNSAAVVVTGKRHEYKYELSNAVNKLLGFRLPKYVIVPDIGELLSPKHMVSSGGAPPILITATVDDITRALYRSQKIRGIDLFREIFGGILAPVGGFTINGHHVRSVEELTGRATEFGFVEQVSEALFSALTPARESRKRAMAEIRGHFETFSGSTCIEYLRRAYGHVDTLPVPQEVGDAPLKYRQDYLDLQDAALDHAKMAIQPLAQGKDSNNFKTIAALVNGARDIDVLSYFTSKKYRDHHIHVVNVLYLGKVLLSRCIGDGIPLGVHVARALHWDNDPHALGGVDAAWCYAALLHDHCYPVAFSLLNAERHQALFDHFGAAAQAVTKAIDSALERLLGPRTRSVAERVLRKKDGRGAERDVWATVQRAFSKEFSGFALTEEVVFDHGVLSAVNFLDHLGLYDMPTAGSLTDKHVFFEAARAMLLHSLTEVKRARADEPSVVKVQFSNNPLGALLILCDEMQEWSRTSLGPKGYQTLIGQMACGPFDGDRLDSEIMRCEFGYVHTKERGFYGWDFDLFAKGKMRNLGRISFDGIPFPRTFEFSVGIDGMSVALSE